MNVAVTQYQPAQPKPRQSDAVHIVVIRSFGDMISNCNCGLIIFCAVHTVDCMLVIPQRKQNRPFLLGPLGPRAGPHFS